MMEKAVGGAMAMAEEVVQSGCLQRLTHRLLEGQVGGGGCLLRLTRLGPVPTRLGGNPVG